MKVTQIRAVRPTAGSSNLGGSGGIIDGGGENFGGGFPPSGQVPVATGSNTWAWASNVQLITADGSNKILSPFVNIASGSNIIFTMDVGPFPTQAFPSNTLRIHSTGGGGGASSLTVKDEGSTLSSAVTSIDFTGAGVTATGTTSVTVDIPGGGSSSDDTEPSGGTIYRGSAGSVSGWTTGQSPTTFDADSTLPDMFYLYKTTMGAGNIITARRAVGGSFPRTYTMRVGAGFLHQNFQGFQILLGEASPGKYLSWGPVHDGVSHYMQRQLWTNDTTSAGNANFPGTGNYVPKATGVYWLRLIVNSSTDIDMQASFDGYVYHEYVTAYNPSFTVGTFGFSAYAFATVEAGIGVRWIHET